MPDTVIKNFDIINNILVIKWNNEEESYIPLKKLRENCPCAGCAGESDIFGDVYRTSQPTRSDESYQLKNIKIIGYYAVQLSWGDGHDTGIYRFELLKLLGT